MTVGTAYMAPDSGEPDAAALRDRVAQLEQTVADQQATIESLSPPTASRRGVLAALTGVAGAGALGAYSQRASAQAAGQIGTQSEPVDVFANTMDANEVETTSMPTVSGAEIIETGSNSNGQFMRFSTGYQICKIEANATADTAWGGLFRSTSGGAFDWDFPVEFSEKPVVNCSSDLFNTVGLSSNLNSSGCFLRIISDTDQETDTIIASAFGSY